MALFALLVVLPAIALSLLSIRVFLGESSRAAFQRREHQQQVLRLLENDLRDWMLSLQQAKVAPGDSLAFEVRDNRVFFPHLNVHLSADHTRPSKIRLSGREAALWQQTQALEAPRATSAASAEQAYRTLLAHDSPLASWARLALLRLSLRHRTCGEAAAWLAAIREKDQAATTESGIPIWVASALLLTNTTGACPSQTATAFLARTTADLQRGRWPLMAAQWAYYSRELLAAVDPGSASSAASLGTAGFLESFESTLPQLLALHQNREWRQSYLLAARHMPALQAVLVLVPQREFDAGRVLPATQFVAEAQRRLDALTSAEDFQGKVGLPASVAQPAVASLPAFPFLQASFVERNQSRWRAHIRRYVIFYMTAALLLIAGVGLVLIYRAVLREAEVSRMKADFVSSVSHEFRTPLSAIDALLERLESGKVRSEEMQQRYYRASRQEVHRLTRMVNQLLSLARLDGGRAEFSRETFDLNVPAEEAVQSFVDLGCGARLVACLDKEHEHRVLADRAATYQCVHNLIDNALKYSPGHARVTIRTGRTDGKAFVEVEDRGPGIPVPEQPLVFEQFYRGGSAQSRGVQGAGIGLAFVKKVMEAHGGQVILESRPGEGSTFRLAFPDAAPSAQPDVAGNGRS
jgi:signal transduction histidine kinase